MSENKPHQVLNAVSRALPGTNVHKGTQPWSIVRTYGIDNDNFEQDVASVQYQIAEAFDAGEGTSVFVDVTELDNGNFIVTVRQLVA